MKTLLQPPSALQRFFLRACFHGSLHWTCPVCANHNSSSMFPDIFSVRCGGSRRVERRPVTGRPGIVQCGKRFIPYLGLRPAPLGAPKRPADYRVPEQQGVLESFPMGELNLDPWRWGDRAHVVDGASSERVAELEAVRRFIERAEAAGMGMDVARLYWENEVAIEERGLVG